MAAPWLNDLANRIKSTSDQLNARLTQVTMQKIQLEAEESMLNQAISILAAHLRVVLEAEIEENAAQAEEGKSP